MKTIRYQACIMVLYVVLLAGIAANAQENLPSVSDYYRHPPVWSHDGTRVALISDTIVEILDTQNLEQIATLAGHAGAVTSVAWNFDGSRIATGDSDGIIVIYDTSTWFQIAVYTGHTELIASLSWSPTSEKLYTARSGDPGNNLHILDLVSDNIDGVTITSTLGTGPHLAPSPLGSKLAAIIGPIIIIQDTVSNQWVEYYRTDDLGTGDNVDFTNWMETVDWDQNGTRLVTGSIGGSIYVWTAANLQPLSILIANPAYNPEGISNPAQSWVRDVTFSPDGERILAASADGTIKVWHADTFEEMTTQQIEPIFAASWSPDADRLFIIRPDGTYRILDTADLAGRLTLRNVSVTP